MQKSATFSINHLTASQSDTASSPPESFQSQNKPIVLKVPAERNVRACKHLVVANLLIYRTAIHADVEKCDDHDLTVRLY